MIEEKTQITPLFSKFLKENGCYVKYCYYYRKYALNDNKYIPSFAVTSIPWDKTEEGVKYWFDINVKWMACLLEEFKKAQVKILNDNGNIQRRENKKASKSNKRND